MALTTRTKPTPYGKGKTLRTTLGTAVLLFSGFALQAQSVLAVFPCTGVPAQHACSSQRTFPNGELTTISANDYYDLSIESACIDKQDSFWKKKMVALEVKITIGDKDPFTVPVFSDRAPSGCHLGVNGYSLIRGVPSNGQNLSLSVAIKRSDENDGLRQILNFASGTQSLPALSNYTTAAIPFLSIANSVVSQAYTSFKVGPQSLLDARKTDLHPPVASHVDRFDLRDGYLLEYQGSEDISDDKIYVESGEVKKVSDGSPLRNGSSWVLFKISKSTRRSDYPGREWYKSWTRTLDGVVARQVDTSALNTQFQKAITLLQADEDFTAGDKSRFVQDFLKTESAILTELAKSPPDYAKIGQALEASRQDVRTVTVATDTHPVSVTNSAAPTVIPALQLNSTTGIVNSSLVANRAVVPETLAMKLSHD